MAWETAAALTRSNAGGTNQDSTFSGSLRLGPGPGGFVFASIDLFIYDYALPDGVRIGRGSQRWRIAFTDGWYNANPGLVTSDSPLVPSVELTGTQYNALPTTNAYELFSPSPYTGPTQARIFWMRPADASRIRIAYQDRNIVARGLALQHEVTEQRASISFANTGSAFSATAEELNVPPTEVSASFTADSDFDARALLNVPGTHFERIDFAAGTDFAVSAVRRRAMQQAMGSQLFRDLARVRKDVQDALGTLVDVKLLQAGSPDPVSGRPEVTEVPLRVRMEGVAGATVATDKLDPASRWIITVYDPVTITQDDSFEWGQSVHKILRVNGLAASTSGQRYVSRCEVA